VELHLADFKVGLSMLYSLGEPFEKMLEEIPQWSVKYIELVDDGEHALDKKRVSELKDVSSAYGVEFAVHAPFAGMNIALESDSLLNAMLKQIGRAHV
jgi:sugar phosphate isomerase/epimerase